MARNIFGGLWGPAMQLEIVSGWNTPNPTGNFSTVNVQVKLIANGQAAIYEHIMRTLTITVDGKAQNFQVDCKISQGQTVLLKAIDVNVPHNSDGNKIVTISANLPLNIGYYTSSSVSESLRLSKIQRASTGTSVKATIGKPVTLNISRQNNNFKHSIWVKYGNYDKKIAGDNIETSYTWTPEMALCEQTPDAASGFGTITYITYNNGAEVGRDSQRLELTIPDNVKPTLSSLSVTDTNTTVAQMLKPNHFIRVLSSIRVNLGQSAGAYGSTIVSYHAEIVGQPYALDKNDTFGDIDFTGQATIRATVTDSRGRTSTPKELTINVLDYHLPQISFDVQRIGSNADQLQIIRNAKIAPLTIDGAQKNIMRLRFKIAPFGTDRFVEDTGPARGDFTTLASLINSAANLGNKYPADKSYIVVGTVEDRFTSSSYRFEVPTRSVVMSMDKDGVGINKVRERGALDVGGDIYANNKAIQQHQLTSHLGMALMATDDWNNYQATGYYTGYNLNNAPESENKSVYVRVTKHNNDYILQEAVDFAGTVSAYRVMSDGVWQEWVSVALKSDLEALKPDPKQKVLYKTLVGLPYGMAAYASRIGDTVTISLERRIIRINQKYENAKMAEKIPIGYRPVQNISLILHANVSANVVGTGVLHINTAGDVSLTSSYTTDAVWLGTVTYVTDNPWPN